MGVKPVLFFSLGAVFFTACSVAQIRFSFPFYHVQPVTAWESPGGKLLGASQENDKRLSDCRPVRGADGKVVQRCLVMFYSDFERMVSEYKKTKQELIDCQRR